jgi:hypothetical protein
VAAVVGAKDVDDPIEATLVFLPVVCEVSGQIDGGAVLAQDDAVLLAIFTCSSALLFLCSICCSLAFANFPAPASVSM